MQGLPTNRSMSGRSRLMGLFIFAAFPFCFHSLHAQWITDPALNTPVCTDSAGQYAPNIVRDGSGGSFIVWESDISQWHSLIFAQHLDKDGYEQWGAGGVLLSDTLNLVKPPKAVSDGRNGFIVAWQVPDPAIVVTRFDHDGSLQWETRLWIDTALPDNYETVAMVSDSSGGVVVATHPIYRNGMYMVYAQRVDSSGNVCWGPDGVKVCEFSNEIWSGAGRCPIAVSDGRGGAVISWVVRDGNTHELFAQWIDSSGTVRWQNNGASILFNPNGSITEFVLKGDGTGGYYAAMKVFSDSTRLYISRINRNGKLAWASGAVMVSDHNSHTIYQHSLGQLPAHDGSMNASLVWVSSRGNQPLFCQSIDTAGTLLWNGGSPLLLLHNVFSAELVPCDNLSMYVLLTKDSRQLYLNKLTSDGALQWSSFGNIVCSRTEYRAWTNYARSRITCAIIEEDLSITAVWNEARDYPSTKTDLYAVRLDSNGIITPVELLSFTAQVRDSNILLSWRTAGENNNHGFEIERSFGDSWERIGFRIGSGTDRSEQDYLFVDPLTPAHVRTGSFRYRLKQVDFDGTFAYSPFVTVHLKPHPVDVTLDVYPQPVSGIATISYVVPVTQPFTLTLYDALGRKLRTLYTGIGEPGTHAVPLDASALPAGTYRVVLQRVDGVQARPFVVR